MGEKSIGREWKTIEGQKDFNVQEFWAQVLQEYGTKVENGRKV